MSSLVTNPASQFINPFFGNVCENAEIYIGKVNTDALHPDNRQDVYLMQWSDEATVNKIPLPQPLVTNSAGCIVYQGLPVTPFVDDAYSITIIGYDGSQLYQSFYVDDPTYWLRLDLVTEPARTADGKHYDPDDNHGINMIGGGAPILSPDFEGEPTVPTPPVGDKSKRAANTEFVTAAVSSIANSGVIGESGMWNGPNPPANAVVEDGSKLAKNIYPELYAVIGDRVATENGLVPDSSTFYVPDSRSRYWRGVDNGASRSGNAVLLKYYEDAFESHSHIIDSRGPTDVRTGDDSSLQDMIPVLGSGSHSLTTEAQGGTETMPKTVAKLPIIWVSDGSASSSVSAWWDQSEHVTSRPLVHHYHEITGELLGSTPANPSPREPGVWLTPALATTENPLQSIPGHVMRFHNGNWIQDAKLFSERLIESQRTKLKEREEREAENIKIKKKGLMNEWLRENGAPYDIDEFLKELK